MRYFDYSPMYYHMSFWPGGIISLIINVLVWVALISFVLLIVRKIAGGHQGKCCGMHGHMHDVEEGTSSYLGIIKMRYAKGEIDKKKFEELKKDLVDEEEAPEEKKE